MQRFVNTQANTCRLCVRDHVRFVCIGGAFLAGPVTLLYSQIPTNRLRCILHSIAIYSTIKTGF